VGRAAGEAARKSHLGKRSMPPSGRDQSCVHEKGGHTKHKERSVTSCSVRIGLGTTDTRTVLSTRQDDDSIGGGAWGIWVCPATL